MTKDRYVEAARLCAAYILEKYPENQDALDVLALADAMERGQSKWKAIGSDVMMYRGPEDSPPFWKGWRPVLVIELPSDDG